MTLTGFLKFDFVIIWSNHRTSGHQKQRLRGDGGKEPQDLATFKNLIL